MESFKGAIRSICCVKENFQCIKVTPLGVLRLQIKELVRKMSIIVYHFTWERKPSYSSLHFDGEFKEWDSAMKCALERAMNDDIDPGEIRDGTETPPLEFAGKIPMSKEELLEQLETISAQGGDVPVYKQGEFVEFSFKEKTFHVKKLEGPSV